LAAFALASLVASTAESLSAVVAAPRAVAPAVSEFSTDDVELVTGEVVPAGTVPVLYNDGGWAVVYRPTRSGSLERPPRTVPIVNSSGVVLCYVKRPEGASAIKCPTGRLPLISDGVVKRFVPRPPKNDPFACPPGAGVVADSDGEILCYVAMPEVGGLRKRRSPEHIPVFLSAKDGFKAQFEIYRPLRPATNGQTVERPARTVPVLDSDGYVLCYAYSPEGGDAVECPAGKIPVIDYVEGVVDGFEIRPAKKTEWPGYVMAETTEDGKEIYRDVDGVALCFVKNLAAPIASASEIHCYENGCFGAPPSPRLAGGKTIVRSSEKGVPVLDSDGEIVCWVRDSGNKAIQAPSGQVPVIDDKGGVERFVSKDAEAPAGTFAELDFDGEVLLFSAISVSAAPADDYEPAPAVAAAPVAKATDDCEPAPAVAAPAPAVPADDYEPAPAVAAPLAAGEVPVFIEGGVWFNVLIKIPAGTVPVRDADGSVLCYVRDESGEAISSPRGMVPVVDEEDGTLAGFARRPANGAPNPTGTLPVTHLGDDEILCFLKTSATFAGIAAPAGAVCVFGENGENGFHRLVLTDELPAEIVPVSDSDGSVLCYVRDESGEAITCPRGMIPVVDRAGTASGFARRPAKGAEPPRGMVKIADENGVARCFVVDDE